MEGKLSVYYFLLFTRAIILYFEHYSKQMYYLCMFIINQISFSPPLRPLTKLEFTLQKKKNAQMNNRKKK